MYLTHTSTHTLRPLKCFSYFVCIISVSKCTVRMWKSENYLRKSVLSSQHMTLGIESRSSDLLSHLTWACFLYFLHILSPVSSPYNRMGLRAKESSSMTLAGCSVLCLQTASFTIDKIKEK